MNPERKRKGYNKAKKIVDIERLQEDRYPRYDNLISRYSRNVRKSERGMTYEQKRLRKLTNHRHKNWNDNPRRKNRYGGSQKTLQEKREEENFKDQQEE